MAARRNSFPARRRRQWALDRLENNLTPGAAGGRDAVDLLDQYRTRMGVAFTQGLTISNIRGVLNPMFITAPTLGDVQEVFIGMSVISLDAMAIGPTAIPDPAVDDADWIWHGYMLIAAGIDTGITPANWRGQRLDINNRSMRKMDQANKTLVITATNLNVSGNDVAVRINGYTRTLLLLP